MSTPVQPVQTTPPPSFASFYSLDQLAATRNNDKTRPDTTPENKVEYDAYIERYSLHSKVLQSALVNYLTALRAVQELAPVEFSDRRGHRWANAWNRFVSGSPSDDESWDLERIARPIHRALSLSMNTSAGADEEVYSKVMGMVESGSFDFLDLSNTYEECEVTGKVLGVDIAAGWKPRLGTVIFSARDCEFLPLAEDAPQPFVRICQIPAPSGEMLICDWFRFEDNLFTNIVKHDAPQDSLNYPTGRAAKTDFYANRYGFMSVAVGDSSPKVLQRSDHLVIGRVDEDEHDEVNDDGDVPAYQGKIMGTLCNDLKWATMVDRCVLVDILSSMVSRPEAEKHVSNYIRDKDVTTVFMPPGDVYFHYTANLDDMAKFGCDSPIAVPRNAATEPYVVISSQPLTWEPLASLAAKPISSSLRLG